MDINIILIVAAILVGIGLGALIAFLMIKKSSESKATNIVKDAEAGYMVVSDLAQPFTIDHTATTRDIKFGCLDIVDAIVREDLVLAVTQRLAQNTQSESEKAASSIRQALAEKGIM